MSNIGPETCQWLSVNEETLFLHDGLIRVTDLVEVPKDVNSAQEGEHEVITFDMKNLSELSDRLLAVCGTQNNAYAKLLEYRLNALRGYWNAQKQLSIEEQSERESNTNEETIALLKKQGIWKEAEQASFSTRISVLLVLPLLQSQSLIDPSLCGVTALVLLSCLRDCAPLSLSKEPGDCLKGLESLLCRWLGEQEDRGSSQHIGDLDQRQNIASALVALTCARGHLKSFIHTVHLLQQLSDIKYLPVADILIRLLETEGGQNQPCTIHGNKHLLCWGYEDLLSSTEKETAEKDKVEPETGRSTACNGIFLYTTNSSGKGLAKVGTGLHGTLRGLVYSRILEIGPGKVAYGNNLLLYRPQSFDQESEVANLCQVLNPNNFQPLKTITKPESYIQPGVHTTIAFCSDGAYFYWIWCPGSLSDKNIKGLNVYLEVFKCQVEDGIAVPIQERVILQKKDDAAVKSLNETLLSRLRPYRGGSSAATLVALTGGDNLSGRKEEGGMQLGSTTCGVPLKSLVRTPIFCDGSSVVLLNPVPGGASSSAARSLFGSSSGLPALRSFAVNMIFNVKDGQFSSRSDLIDAPTCALARGATLSVLGTCFDVKNNCIWTCSADWVDQYYNPGHQAPHHIRKRLALTTSLSQELRREESDKLNVPTTVVICSLLQHVGSMCLHQLNSDFMRMPLGTYPFDLMHMKRVCDILEKAMLDGEPQIIVCCLIVLQMIFKVSIFKGERQEEKSLVKKARELIWSLSTSFKLKSDLSQETMESVQREACNVVTSGLLIMYPTAEERHTLLHHLLIDGDTLPGLDLLRDMLLVEFADRLRSQTSSSSEIQDVRLSDELVHYILKVAVKESCNLLQEAQRASKGEFDKLLSSIPVASPCLRYLMSLQSHLLSVTLLFTPPDKEIPEGEDPLAKIKLLQSEILTYSSKVFAGSCQVLDVLLESCNKIIAEYPEELEYRLQGLERVAKATILGHLLPVLLTSKTHANLQCLNVADTLMPQLVQLVLLSSQAALLLKSQVQAILSEDREMDTDADVIELIGQPVTSEKVTLTDQEEQGFLAGLKIPAPWASGKSVESIHPVRDNYKFKETVHIPGARCLYLRFDPRCSSQYDYDKLAIHAGPNTNAKKVVEYGGNTLGFGSRSVLGSGWPKDLVKVEGDTVTFSFEMRSGREHNTPDKAMWGFMVTVRAQECTDEVTGGLPFLADLALGLSVLSCTMLHLLYQGPEKTKEEVSCEHLLKSKLLQRCVWQSESGYTMVTEGHPTGMTSSRLSHIKLPVEILHSLRTLTHRQALQLRPSIRDVIMPDVLEERIISAVVKHLSLQDTVRFFTPSKEQQTKEFQLLTSVTVEVYKKIDGLLRQLQALADLEQRWLNEVKDHRQGNVPPDSPPFFHDYHLQEKFEAELKWYQESQESPPPLSRTKYLVEGILARLDLLLHVNIPTQAEDSYSMSRTAFHTSESVKTVPHVMVKSDTDILRLAPFTRSFSAPSGVDSFQDDIIIDLIKMHRRRQSQRLGPNSILQDLVEDEELGSHEHRPPHVALLSQLFQFIGSDPEKAISSEDFLKAAQLRWRRGNTRKQALIHMKELLSAAARVGGATHLVAAVTSVLRHGPRVEELTCGGMVSQVREAFAETMTSVVQLAARYPISCCNSIGLLCIVPYTRAEEKCLVRSGLVHLLDKLCSLANHRAEMSMETQSTRQKVSAMAWAGFQVLASRCVTWETEEGSQFEELEHSGLARQVSVLLTNHLARATETGGNEAAGTEALQEVLSLLNNLSRSRMGKAILSQPACVSKLLSLLLDQRPSPKLVLIILQLCRVALPLVNTVDCESVKLPVWGQHVSSSYWSSAQPVSDPPARIISLLLAKLGDFLVPGDIATVSSRHHSPDSDMSKAGMRADKDKQEDSDVQNGRLSVFIHKREDQLSHEVIQPLLSSENRPFRLRGGTSMEKVVRMDREMTKTGKAEIATDDVMTALRKAAKWAQMGLVVSTGPPVDSTPVESPTGDKKKNEKETVCREKNSELARTDPVRPFISAHVANSMAAEVIELLHSLLTAPESNIAKPWSDAVRSVLINALSSLSVLLNSMETLSSPRCPSQQLMSMAKQANAALCALSGFTEMIKPGCHVKITGDVHNTSGTVVSISEQTGMVTLQLDPDPDGFYSPRYSDTIKVPHQRLVPARHGICSTQNLPMTEAVIRAVQAVLLPQDDKTCSLQQRLPISGDGNSLTNQLARVITEIQSRACRVLAHYLDDINFTKEFIQCCGSTIDMLKSLAKECGTGDRLQVILSRCDKLRMLYRDCVKPPPPPSKVDSRNKEMMWDSCRSFPPVRSCLFSQGQTIITFLGDPSAGSGLPRGTLVYANLPIPQQAPSFYWELEICSFGETQEESGTIVSFGFAPPAEKKDGAWTNPVGTCLFLNNGKAVHYNGASLLQWRSVRLDISMSAGDIAGIGWERMGEAPGPNQPPKGRVYFTYKGRRLPATIDDVSGGMYPVVHIQKKAVRVRANFGARPFAYAEGQQHREAADEANDLTREIRESFGHLPFHTASESDSEGAVTAASSPTSVSEVKDLTSPTTGPPCKTVPIPMPLKEYSPETCQQYKLLQSYDNFVTTGPDALMGVPGQDEESDDESTEDEGPTEDHYALLVKAWEQKVFPVIRRRFRNEAERKDGLEQIKGALQLGMTDIARQTVEFLYEENGGMPRDLHLPTIEDIKEELAKFTIDRVRKGTTVVVRDPTGGSTISGTTVLPKFAVRSMLRTFGLVGAVLDIDMQNELVQVETYLRSEGVLVRFWYPIEMLERPPQGMRKSTITGGQILDTSNISIHRELVRCEYILARMFCRTALLKLIDHCNSAAVEVISCSTSLSSGMAASAALLQELDIENLQLLSNELLCPPQPHGTVRASSLEMTACPQQCLAAHVCSFASFIYTNTDRLMKELAVAIARAANQGEDYLIELTNQICICLQTAPEMFQFEEFPVTEVKVSTDVYFPGAACLVVSCKADPKAAKKEISPYKSPWARIFCYTGQKVRKTGQVSKQEVLCYPRDSSSTSNLSDQYIPAVIPCDRIHLRLGVSPPPGIIVTIHALPPQFLLALAYIETLITEKHGCGMKSCGQNKENEEPCDQMMKSQSRFFLETELQRSLWNLDDIVIPPPVFSHMIEIVCGYMWRTDIPALVKEYLFHLLAQSIRILHYSEGSNGTKLPTIQPHLNPTNGLFVQLQAEMKMLYDEETKGWATLTTSSGTGIGIGVMDQGRFSSYFHALMEVNLAFAEISKMSSRYRAMSGAALSTTEPGSAMKPPTSPTHVSKRKKLKTKREKKDSPPNRPEGHRTSESEGDTVGGPSASSSSSSPSTSSVSVATVDQSLPLLVSGASAQDGQTTAEPSVKPEDVLWFHRALTVSQILRCIAFSEKNGKLALVDAVSDAAQVLNTSTAHQRLLIVTGIPCHQDPAFVKQAISKACAANGGADRDGIFLPTVSAVLPADLALEVSKEEPKEGEVKEQAQVPDTSSSTSPANVNLPSTTKSEVRKQIKGYAVISVRSKTKLESIKKAILKNKQLVEGLSSNQEELVDVPEIMPSISGVNASLVAEHDANNALEEYLLHKFFSNKVEISDTASLALTEIFHSCFIGSSEPYRQESGFIYLGKEQILQHTPENLLCAFFNNMRPPKKSLSEQVMHVLRQYGMARTPDKEESPVTDKNGKSKGKKPQKITKEKVVMVTTERTPGREKKSREKDMPLEKAGKDVQTSESASKITKVRSNSVSKEKEESKCLTLDGFLQYVADLAKQDIRAVWRALLACGFDIHLERCSCLDTSQAQYMAKQWTPEMDTALVQLVNSQCQKLTVSPARIHPHEVTISDNELASERYACLQGVPIESIRLRFALLQSLNNTLETFFLPLVDLRPSETYSRSTAALISKVRYLIFYDTKITFMNRLLNATAKRKPDQAMPEIILDPLEVFKGEKFTSLETTFCQAYRQLQNTPSSQFCVKLASGGDPTYSFNVKFTGEEVHGTSGSFRHFLCQVAHELQGPHLSFLVPCNGSTVRGRTILRPGPVTFPEEKLLHFFGQLLGITIRADIPLGLDLMPLFWKSLVSVSLDPVTDLQEADYLTYSYIKKIEMVESESELQALCADVYPHFMYPSLAGEEVELIPNGRHVLVSWENHHQYIEAIRRLRMSELSSKQCVAALRCGLATVVPLQLLTLMSPLDMELRTCGLPYVDLDFLKAHTMYQVGLMESDKHIEFFWNALESFSQEDLCRFIKFACNQERIPMTCPCRVGGPDTTHVPPYPMKIAPPDGAGPPDGRYIRVETCMFMIKLPQYSCQEIVTQRLMYAIYCREDPLSG
ncbi:hypothetical protein ACJMK2_011476 [Sinanodonta woodiana]|uniref:HECT domain-containing protein n=1 Tax=Sinanodonta woodiana TaxID=1069815 RepID=A0ABD3V5N3_SINWO